MMKRFFTTIVVIFAICLSAGFSTACKCDDLETLRKYFVTQGNITGMGAYKDRVLYLVRPWDDGSILLSKWNAFTQECIFYYEDSSKCVKESGPVKALRWNEGRGILVVRDAPRWIRTNINKWKWRSEVTKIVRLITRNEVGPLQAQRLLAVDLGYIE